MAKPNPTQFFNFYTLNRITLPFLATSPSIKANL
jgi:hypothetical protein